VAVNEKAPLGGPITVEVAGARHAISLELARMVVVLSPEEAEAESALDGSQTVVA
jgi:hypothetical protein